MQVNKAPKIICSVIIITAFMYTSAAGYDDQVTHKLLTKNAVENSKLNTYLNTGLALPKGVDTKIPADSGMAVRLWLEEGSKLEDKEPCRRSNHFHNPINENWQYAGMDELPSWACDAWHPLNIGQAYSALTWATGYITQPPLNPTPTTPDGLKAGFSSDADKQSQNWDKAREYYYQALTLPSSGERESYLARSFQTVGQVLQILQDYSASLLNRAETKFVSIRSLS